MRAFDDALAKSRTVPREQVIEVLEGAVDIYRGPLLADVSWPWVEVLRQKYQSRFVDAALRLAELLAATNPVRSDQLAEQVVALEPENEVGYERLIRNAEKRGDTLAVRRTARAYEQAAAQLGIPANQRLLLSGR